MEDCQKKILLLEQEIENLKEQLTRYRYDHLTGLKMRKDFENDLHRKVLSGEDFYLVIFDVNDLHSVNRTKGYQAGDMLLRVVATSLIETCKTTIYRIGGDEFACMPLDINFEIDSIQHIEYGISKSSKDKTASEMLKEADNMIIKKKK